MVHDEERLILATGRYLGEGFDDPRPDTLFLTVPISWRGTLAQYVGRLHRERDGKSDVLVVDCVDANVTPDALMDLITASGFDLLQADANDWIEAAGLGWRHGDPFDRLIYTMAHLRNLALVTADETLLRLGGDGMVDAR